MYTKEQTIKAKKEKLKEITESIEDGILKIFSSSEWRNYLRTMSRFPRYSLNNKILIYLQCPNATHVCGYKAWGDFKRYVKRGEKGITILAPVPYRRTVSMNKIDAETHEAVRDANGDIVTEENEIKMMSFKPATVFDVSQTDGEPLPEIVMPLDGDVENFELLKEALIRTAPVPVTFEKIENGSDGFFSPHEQRIAIKAGMGEVQTICAMVHEIAHSLLHDRKRQVTEAEERWRLMMVFDNGTRKVFRDDFGTEEECEQLAEAMQWCLGKARLEIEMAPVERVTYQDTDPATMEVQAESVAYTVTQYLGIDTADNSLPYIGLWSQGRQLEELRQSLIAINQTASYIINGLEKALQGTAGGVKKGEEQTEDEKTKKN